MKAFSPARLIDTVERQQIRHEVKRHNQYHANFLELAAFKSINRQQKTAA